MSFKEMVRSSSNRVGMLPDEDLAAAFAEAGFIIEGPVPSLAKALSIAEQAPIDGALLDINLDGEKVWQVADALVSRGTPIVFVTSYERENIPDKYRDMPLSLKPIDAAKVVETLTLAAGR